MFKGVNNKRSGEYNIPVSSEYNNEFKLLNPKYAKVDIQDDIIKQLNLESYRTYPDPWKTNYNSVDNFILACYSKKVLTTMIEEHIEEYDYVMFMRPDCLYLDKINIDYFSLINDQNILIPNFAIEHCKHKINDRFAITNTNNYKIYGNIFDNLLNLSKK